MNITSQQNPIDKFKIMPDQQSKSGSLTEELSNSTERLKPARSKSIRFLVLFLLSMVVLGNQYAFNNPQALQNSLEEDLDIGETAYDLLYTVFAFPNIFATFIIGFLIDYLGVRVGLIALSIGITVFQLVIAIGGYTYSYMTILIGRILFGLASESLITAQASMVSYWFKGKELAFALGIAVTFPELGNALNSWLTPIINEATGSLGTPFLVSVFVCVIGLICALAAAHLDKQADLEDEANNLRVVELVSETGEVESEKIKWQDLKTLNRSFWLVVVLCMCAVSLYVPFMDNANSLYQKRFCFSQVSSGKALVITYLVAALCSPPLGYVIDKVGYKRYFIITSFFIFLVAQMTILFFPQCENNQENGSMIGLVFIGLGYCFYGNCILPSVPLVVKKKVTGTAFGIMQMIESIALAFFPLISGAIIDGAPSPSIGYKRDSIFFVCIGVVGLGLSFGLFFIPERAKNKLDRISKQKELVIIGTAGGTSEQSSDFQPTGYPSRGVEIQFASSQEGQTQKLQSIRNSQL